MKAHLPMMLLVLLLFSQKVDARKREIDALRQNNEVLKDYTVHMWNLRIQP